MKYRLQRNSFEATGSWTTITCVTGNANQGGANGDVWDFSGESNGTYNQISRFSPMVVDCNVSDTFQIKVTKTGTGGDALVYFFDLHGKINSFGSDEEIAKAP